MEYLAYFVALLGLLFLLDLWPFLPPYVDLRDQLDNSWTTP